MKPHLWTNVQPAKNFQKMTTCDKKFLKSFHSVYENNKLSYLIEKLRPDELPVGLHSLR